MKHLLIIGLLLFSVKIFGQTNTFPSTGNVGIGTISTGNLLSVSKGGLATSTISTITGFEARASSSYTAGFGGRLNFHITKYSNYHIGNDTLALVALKWWDAGNEVRKGMFAIATSNGDVEPTNRFVVDYNGNVGIGTTSPSSKLDVLGAIQVSNQGTGYRNGLFLFTNSLNAGDDTGIDFCTSTSKSSIGARIVAERVSGGYSNLNFKTLKSGEQGGEPSSSMFIKNNGNIGIGIIDPTYKLTVSGTISAIEVRVSTTPNSDFVFEPNYKLKPIEEVETFIKENKHLPDIPSAEEFKENGVGLGEMDNMLLRKVEELTLYVIELKKENEGLKETNDYLKTQYQKIEDLEMMVKALMENKN